LVAQSILLFQSSPLKARCGNGNPQGFGPLRLVLTSSPLA
jgi:hypothetical protein